MRRSYLVLALLSVAACARAGEETELAQGELGAISYTETTATSIVEQLCGPGSTRGCYTNYSLTADLDGDGFLDLVFANGGGHFEPGAPEAQAVYFGDGSGKFNNASAAFPGLKPSIVRQVAIADFDGDGRLDVYFPAGYGTTDDQLFMQVAPRKFENQTAARIGAVRSHAGAVHAGDIDNDGDIDLVVADWGAQPNPDADEPPSAVTVRTFLNDGRGRFTAGPTLAAPGGSSATDIDLQDLNGDLSLDIVLTQRNGQSRIYLNDGQGRFEDATVSKAFPRKQGPFTFNAELCDLDNDGDLDLLFDGGGRFMQNHSTQLLINDGTGRFTDETARIIGEPRSDDNQVKCVDVDYDGRFDLVVASLTNATEKLLHNSIKSGSLQLVHVPNIFPRLGDPTLSIDFGDFDGDGKIDMLTAQGEIPGRPWVERIFKNSSPFGDTRKPVFRRIEQPTPMPNQPTTIRLAVSDSYTSETGQHVKAVSFDVLVTGQIQSVPAKFVGGDVFRAVIPANATSATPRATDRAGNEAVGEPIALSSTISY